MQFGFFTTVVGEQPIDEVAGWAAREGYDALEIDTARHVGDLSRVRQVVEAVRAAGVEVCALTCPGAVMGSDRAARERVRRGLEAAVEGALEAGVDVVVTFAGRDETLSEDDNYAHLAGYLAALAGRAARGGVKIVLENWPGSRNNYLSTTPAGWTHLFDLVPTPNLGLNFDPSHLVRLGIDHEQALHAVAGRVFLAHAKDTEIFAQRLQQVGYHGDGWWTYRLPGHGLIDWRRWLSLLREAGYDGVVSVEHEDANYGWPRGSLQERQEGLREALRVLRAAHQG